VLPPPRPLCGRRDRPVQRRAGGRFVLAVEVLKTGFLLTDACCRLCSLARALCFPCCYIRAGRETEEAGMFCAAVSGCFLATHLCCLLSFLCDQPRGHDMLSWRTQEEARWFLKPSMRSIRQAVRRVCVFLLLGVGLHGWALEVLDGAGKSLAAARKSWVSTAAP